ncbi:MAG: phosphatidylserine decarboxylase [Alphaproteobacteria bacterium]|nr:phosphatidylserine decarboxylase [Alphaproteobacteria bacterium]
MADEKLQNENNKQAEKAPEENTQKAKMSWQRFIFPNIHMDGWKFVGLAALFAIVLGVISAPLGVIGWILTAYVFFFFRDPDRVTPIGDNFVISPADGLVNAITMAPPPAELEMGEEPVVRVSVFLSVFNVHINRVPATGTITRLVYIPGKFFNASLDKASKYNERQLVAMKTAHGHQDLVFVQIAGLVARRILCDLNEGDKVVSGQKFGLIRFGSRMDIYLPKGVEPQVVCGQEVVAGETVIADMAIKGGRKGEVR